MAIFTIPPDLSKIPDDDAHYEERKAILKKHFEITSRINYAFQLLNHVGWWLGWRGSMISLPRIVYGDEIGTAAVSLDPNSGTIQLWFNGTWAQNLSSGDLAFVYAHETLHAVYDHLARRKAYPKLWNIVCDAFINEYLHTTIKWNEGVEHKDRLDYVLKEGVRWASLPKAIQEQYPVDKMNSYSADQIYIAMLDDMKKRGVDTKMFMKGKLLRKKQPKDPNAPPPGKPIRQTVEIKQGDLVRVKSKDKVGKVRTITRDSKGRVTNVEVDPISDKEFKEIMTKHKPLPPKV